MNVLSQLMEVDKCGDLKEGWFWGQGEKLEESTIGFAKQLGCYLLHGGLVFETIPLKTNEIALQCSNKNNGIESVYRFIVNNVGAVDVLVYENGIYDPHDLYEFQSVEEVMQFLKL